MSTRRPKLAAALAAAQYSSSLEQYRIEREAAAAARASSRDMEDAVEEFRRSTANARRSSPLMTDARSFHQQQHHRSAPPFSLSSVYDDIAAESSAARALNSESACFLDNANARLMLSRYASSSNPNHYASEDVMGAAGAVGEEHEARPTAVNSIDNSNKRKQPKSREANRRAVQQYRQRKKEEVDTLTTKNDALLCEVMDLRAELERLKKGVSPLTIEEREELERLRKLHATIGTALHDFDKQRVGSRRSTDTGTPAADNGQPATSGLVLPPPRCNKQCHHQGQRVQGGAAEAVGVVEVEVKEEGGAAGGETRHRRYDQAA